MTDLGIDLLKVVDSLARMVSPRDHKSEADRSATFQKRLSVSVVECQITSKAILSARSRIIVPSIR